MNFFLLKKFFLLSFLLFFSFPFSEISFEEIKITSELNKNKVKMGEKFIFTVTVTGNFNTTPKVKLPSFSDFKILSSQQHSSYNIKEGKYEVRFIYEIYLLPKNPGFFSIDSVELNYKNHVYKTQPLTIEVIPSEFEEESPHPKKIPPWKDKKSTLI